MAALQECRSVEFLLGLADFTEQEKGFGDYTAGRGRYGFLTGHRQRLKEPVPCRGFQLIWELPPLVEALVRKQLSVLG